MLLFCTHARGCLGNQSLESCFGFPYLVPRSFLFCASIRIPGNGLGLGTVERDCLFPLLGTSTCQVLFSTFLYYFVKRKKESPSPRNVVSRNQSEGICSQTSISLTHVTKVIGFGTANLNICNKYKNTKKSKLIINMKLQESEIWAFQAMIIWFGWSTNLQLTRYAM